MEILCTRPGCPRPINVFTELDDRAVLKSTTQKYCTACGMELILAGHYIPVRLLGKGGFGAAFLAFDRYTPSLRQCVVKQFQPEGNLSETSLKKALDLFEREAMVLDTLGRQHEQIPDLYAFFPLTIYNRAKNTNEQFFYLVQELIDGENLEQELETKGTFSEAQVREVLTEILKVLKFVHENGAIHRDIKPSNIMRAHNTGRLYLLDFGAVKQVTIGAGQTNQPEKSTGIYSVGFAPPEQIKGGEVYPCTDLYALGVTCLNLLTGKSAQELYDNYHDRWNWKPYAPKISSELAGILDKMLLPTPRDRFQTAAEILNLLHPTTTIQSQSQVSIPALTPPPANPVTPAPNLHPTTQTTSSRFSLLEILSMASFTGFEGSLLVIAFYSFLSTGGIIVGLMLLGGLIFAQYRRIIEGKDLPIIAMISLLLIMLLPFLRGDLGFQQIILLAVFASAGAVGITALFRLVYQLLSRIL